MRNYTKLEKELFLFLRKNNATVEFFKLWNQFKDINFERYNPKLSIHQNLFNLSYGDYLSPKHIFWCILRMSGAIYSNDMLFWDKISTKWRKYYFNNKICSKTCKNKFGLIQEIEYASKK